MRPLRDGSPELIAGLVIFGLAYLFMFVLGFIVGALVS